MYAITGVSGHVGGAAARELVGRGEPVRVVVRDEAKGADWSRRGAEVAVAGFEDRATLAEAFRGCDGAFVMLPFDLAADDLDAHHRRMADSIAAAVGDSGIAHVVLLSSVGADLPDGTGPIRWLHHLEERLRGTGARVSAVRSWHFQENVEQVLGAARDEGVYPVFADSADIPFPTVATRDIGTAVAEYLVSPPEESVVIGLDAPRYTHREIARELAAVLGRPLDVVVVPRQGWVDALVGAGMPRASAAELADLYEAERRDLLHVDGDVDHKCTTGIEETLRRVVAAAS